ncbi:MAG: IgGFc-binding protein [Myxococcales bacterium]|nr:IgGFc-binding protein [Myxococcales bacterium]
MNQRIAITLLIVCAAACGPAPRSGSGVDAAMPCNEGSLRCNVSTYEVCRQGTWTVQEDCAVACDATLGCVSCTPGQTVCQDGNVHSCGPDGELGGQTQECTGSTICQNGQCVDACADAAANKSYIGCEYWAADLDNAVEVIAAQGSLQCAQVPGVKNVSMQVCANAGNTQVAGSCDPPGNTCPSGMTCHAAPVCILDAQQSPFAIVVSNPQSRTVNVTVTAANGQSFMRAVPAGEVVALTPQSNGIPDQSLDGTGTQRRSYKVTADLPIVAYQFNPLDNVNVFSNDASLLIPRTAFDVDYYVMSWPSTNRRTPAPGTNNYHGYLSIIAWQDTMVEVTPSVAVRASATQPAIAAGAPTTFTLAAFDVLTLQADGVGDLTGTRVKSVNGTSTFGVFGGHEAMSYGETMAPDPQHSRGPCCADHIEEMLYPASTWGKAFAIARSKARGTNEPDVLKIIAQKPNTQVTFDPAPIGTCPTLQPGGSCQVKIAADTAVTATEPVLVGHFLESTVWQDPFFGGAVGEGDPSMALGVPTEQYRTDYTILVPAQYAKNFISISAPANGAILVDNQPVQMDAFASGAFRGARVPVTAGQHRISCPAGCGVLVYGYSDAVSYMFAGGLDLKQIVIN